MEKGAWLRGKYSNQMGEKGRGLLLEDTVTKGGVALKEHTVLPPVYNLIALVKSYSMVGITA